MKYKIFSIPIQGDEEKEKTLNHFCINHRVIRIDQQLANDGQRHIWTFCVEYEASNGASPQTYRKKPAIDYREVLNEVDFACYAKLRELRKTISQQDKIPAYAIFTNEQLAEIVKQRISSVSALSKIEGVGEAKREKYGKQFIEMLKECF